MADTKPADKPPAAEKAAPEETANYKALTLIQHDLEEFEPGDVLTLTAKHAKPLLDVRAIEAAGAKATGEKDGADA